MKKKSIHILACAFVWVLSTHAGAQIITTVVGIGTHGYTGDNGPATAAQLYFPAGFDFDASGNLFIADEVNNVIRRVNTSGIITTVVGNGYGAGLSYGGYTGDNGPATAAELNAPTDLAFDNFGNLYIADLWNNVIRKVNNSGIISTVAGNGYGAGLGYGGYAGDNGPATDAELSGPSGVTFDLSGNLLISDQTNNVVRKVNTSGVITTVAGNASAGYSGDNGSATDAKFCGPTCVAVDKYGNLLIADQCNSCIRKVNSSGVITTVAGNGTSGYSGDNSPATNAELHYTTGVCVDTFANFFIDDYFNHVIRKVNTSGIITTIAGDGTPGYFGDNGPATAAKLYKPYATKVDSHGNLFIGDCYNHVIRKVTLPGPENVKQITASDLQVFPNPATNELTVQNANGSKLVLYNMLGKEMLCHAITSYKQSMDISQLPAGIYIAQIINREGEKKSIRVVKE